MKILLVDDHALFRDGVALMLKVIAAEVEVMHAKSCEQALERLDAGAAPQLILLDLGLPGVGGLEALRLLRERSDDATIVMLSGSDDHQLARACVDAGAMGFIHKSSDARGMVDALRQVLNGQIVLPAMTLGLTALEAGATVGAEFTARQLEVLARVIKGKTNKAIARELGINESTVKSHVGNVLSVLGVNNRTEAVYAVRKLGLRFS
jgi:DNA-binding NarL/FixJ family response regulator